MKLLKFLVVGSVIICSNVQAIESGRVNTLKNICQSEIGRAPTVFTSKIIHDSLTDDSIVDCLQKRQLQINTPVITPEVIDSLIKKGCWQDPWGYVWQLVNGNYNDLSILKDLGIMPKLTVEGFGDHSYQYGAHVFYEDFDPVDLVERITSTYVTMSLKLI